MSINKIIAKKIFTNEEIEKLEGEFIDEKFIIHFINSNTDVIKEDGSVLEI